MLFHLKSQGCAYYHNGCTKEILEHTTSIQSVVYSINEPEGVRIGWCCCCNYSKEDQTIINEQSYAYVS